MTTPISTLTCPSCGGRLQIVSGIDRFACGHCGNEHVVHRESGIVYLEPIAHDIRHIRTGVDNLRGGVDKTAAELAIVRLQKEIVDLEKELKAVSVSNVSSWMLPSNLNTALGALTTVLFIFSVNTSSTILWVIFCCNFLATLLLWARRVEEAQKKKKEDILDIKAEINETREALMRNRKLV